MIVSDFVISLKYTSMAYNLDVCIIAPPPPLTNRRQLTETKTEQGNEKTYSSVFREGSKKHGYAGYDLYSRSIAI